MSEQTERFFAVYIEAAGHDKPLVMTHLPFGRLMDDVVVPLQRGESFFVDGALLSKEIIRRLKIIRQQESFDMTFGRLHWNIRASDVETQRLYADQYHIRLEALLRESGDAVASQVIKAYDLKIKPSLKDYHPKREELIKAALEVFLQAMKTLGAGRN